MASEITAAGYQDLRDHIEATWQYIEIRDEEGDPLFRIGVSDDRVSWTHAPGAQVLVMEVVLSGSDEEIDGQMPLTVAGVALFTGAEGGSELAAESLAPFTFGAAEDELTIEFRVQVPRVE